MPDVSRIREAEYPLHEAGNWSVPDIAPAGGTRAVRDPAIDIYKGIAILAVMIHHVSGIGMRDTVPGTTSHLLGVLINRATLFCVPAFLFLTVFLLAKSLLRRPVCPIAFWRRRVPRILVPYLLWTLFYLLLNATTGPPRLRRQTMESLLDLEKWRVWLLYGKAYYHLYFMAIILQIYLVLPGLVGAAGAIASTKALFLRKTLRNAMGFGLPSLFCLMAAPRLDPGTRPFFRWAGWAMLGAAIYLLTTAVSRISFDRRPRDESGESTEVNDAARSIHGQMQNIPHKLPSGTNSTDTGTPGSPPPRPVSMPPAAWKPLLLHACIAFAWQIAVFWIHRIGIRSPYPATLAIWYIWLTLLAIDIARHEAIFRDQWARWRLPVAVFTVISFLSFFPAAISYLGERPVDAFYYVTGYWVFTAAASLYLLGIGPGIALQLPRFGASLALLGSYSMELYLLHPALLSPIGRVHFKGSSIELAFHMLGVLAWIGGVSLLLAVLFRRVGLSSVLFGR